MIIADTCAALAMASVGYLVWSDQFQVWHLYAAEAIASMSMAFSVPAAKASISLMVAKDQLGRAAGMFEVTEGIAALAGPLLAGMLLGAIGLSGIILLDILSFCIAVTSLFFLRLPATAKPSAPSGEGAWHVVMTALYDFRRACAYFRHYPSMARIYAQVAMADFLTGMAATFFTPLVLNAHSERSLAMISSIGAVGALLGGALMIAWGGPKRWLTWLLLFECR